MKEGGRNVTTVLGRKGISSSSSSYFVSRFTLANTYAIQPINPFSKKKNTHRTSLRSSEKATSTVKRNGTDDIDRDNR